MPPRQDGRARRGAAHPEHRGGRGVLPRGARVGLGLGAGGEEVDGEGRCRGAEEEGLARRGARGRRGPAGRGLGRGRPRGRGEGGDGGHGHVGPGGARAQPELAGATGAAPCGRDAPQGPRHAAHGQERRAAARVDCQLRRAGLRLPPRRRARRGARAGRRGGAGRWVGLSGARGRRGAGRGGRQDEGRGAAKAFEHCAHGRRRAAAATLASAAPFATAFAAEAQGERIHLYRHGGQARNVVSVPLAPRGRLLARGGRRGGRGDRGGGRGRARGARPAFSQRRRVRPLHVHATEAHAERPGGPWRGRLLPADGEGLQGPARRSQGQDGRRGRARPRLPGDGRRARAHGGLSQLQGGRAAASAATARAGARAGPVGGHGAGPGPG